MTQTDTSRRRLAEDTLVKLERKIASLYPADKLILIGIIESALTTLATQIREEDARIAESVMFDGLPVDPHRRGFKSAQDKIAAAIRARQEK